MTSGNPPSPIPLSARLLGFIHRTGLTEAEAARHFGVSHSTFYKWLHWGQVPGAAVFRLLDLLELIFDDYPWVHMRLLEKTPCRPVKRALSRSVGSFDSIPRDEPQIIQLLLDL